MLVWEEMTSSGPLGREILALFPNSSHNATWEVWDPEEVEGGDPEVATHTPSY